MPATSVQLLANIPPFVDGGATAFNPTPNLCNASATLSIAVIQPVASSSSPRPMSAAVNINLAISAQAAQTLGGVIIGRVRVPAVAVSAGALSGSYNPVTDLGLLPYGGLVGNNALLYGTPSEIAIPLASLGMPTSLANAASWQSAPIWAMNQKHITWALTSDHTINLSITRYADRQGISSIGAVTATATASAAMAIDNHDGLGFQSFAIGATNTSGSVAVLTSFSLLLSAT